MAISKDDDVFQGKSFSDLMKDIYDNQNKKSSQISILVNELKNFIKSTGDAALIVPLIKDYLDIGVRNDEHLIKLAAIFQKLMSSENRNEVVAKSGNMDGQGSAYLSEDERVELNKIAKEYAESKAIKEIESDKILDIDGELGNEMAKIKIEIEKMDLNNKEVIN